MRVSIVVVGMPESTVIVYPNDGWADFVGDGDGHFFVDDGLVVDDFWLGGDVAEVGGQLLSEQHGVEVLCLLINPLLFGGLSCGLGC